MLAFLWEIDPTQILPEAEDTSIESSGELAAIDHKMKVLKKRTEEDPDLDERRCST